MAFLELQGLDKRYDDVTAVADFSLSVTKGEFVCLLGPSGCGKTTTLQMVAGFTPPTRGHIVLDGRDISGLLFGTAKQSSREAHYYFAGYNLQAVRQGPWKLALAPQPETMGKGISSDASGKEPRLYNLDHEIGEQTNLAAKNPEIVQRLQTLAAAMSARIGGNEPSERRAAGNVEKPKTLYPTDPAQPGKPKKKLN